MRENGAILREFEEALRRAGLSRADVARRVGTQPAAVRRLLSRKNGHNPTLATMVNLAEALGYEVRLVPKSVEAVAQAHLGRVAGQLTVERIRPIVADDAAACRRDCATHRQTRRVSRRVL